MSNELILYFREMMIFSGGGLHADLATYTTNKQHGFVAVTCLTAMTENGFEVIPVDPTTFAQQLNSLKDVPFSAIKLGLCQMSKWQTWPWTMSKPMRRFLWY